MLTGFALRYPSSWLAMAFINEHVRSLIHRIAGVVLIAVSLYHIWYIITNPDGRQLIKDMLPDWKDVTDVRDALLYYLGSAGRTANVPPLLVRGERRSTGRWCGACSSWRRLD